MPTLVPLLMRAGFFDHGITRPSMREEPWGELPRREVGFVTETRNYGFDALVESVVRFGLTPYATSPTLEGGRVMVFVSASGYGYIEVAQDGTLYAFATDRATHRTAWAFETCRLQQSVRRIKDLLTAPLPTYLEA